MPQYPIGTIPKYPTGVASCVGVATSAGLAATYTGLCLSNPAGSGKNLVLVRASGALDVAPAALTAYGLIIGYSAAGVVTHTTALTPLTLSPIGTGVALVGLADAACTIVGTPAWGQFFGETPSATGVTTFNFFFDGTTIIPPGGYAAIGSTIAGPAAGLYGSLVWFEKPLGA